MKIKIGLNSLILTIVRFFNLMIMILFFMILTRFLSLYDYGTFSQILLTTNISTVVLSLGLSTSVNYFFPKYERQKEKENFLSVFFSLIFTISFFIGIVLLFLSPYISKYFDNKNLLFYSYAFIFLPFCIISKQSFDNILIVSNRIYPLMIFRIILSLLLLLVATLNYILKLNFNHFLLQYIFVEIILSVIFILYIYFKIIRFKFRLNFSLIKSILKFSIPLGLASTLSTINIELDKFVIGRFFDTEKLAIYTNGSKEMPVTIISVSIVSILLPIIVKEIKDKNYDRVLELWNISNRISLIVISFFISLFFVFAPEFITILYSSKYIQSVTIFRIYSLILFLRFTYFGMILNASGKTGFILYTSFFSLILNLILNILFVKIFGFVGPAISTFLCSIIAAFLQVYYSLDILKVKFSKIFEWKRIFIIIFNTLSFSFILFVLKNSFLKFKINQYLIFIFLSTIFSLFYFFLFYKKELFNLWNQLNDYKEKENAE